MNTDRFDINKLRIASPCPVGWDTMSGDDRKRHCDLCHLNVYNVGEMSRTEVERLVGEGEGRLCIRLYRRVDGMVITRDCPIGFRAIKGRVSRFAGAAFASILGLFSVSYGQTGAEKQVIPASSLRIVSSETFDEKGAAKGTLYDINGAVIAGAEIVLSDRSRPDYSLKLVSNGEGEFSAYLLSPGVYCLTVNAPGFRPLSVTALTIERGKALKLNLTLTIDPEQATLGVVGSFVSETVTLERIQELPENLLRTRPLLTLKRSLGLVPKKTKP